MSPAEALSVLESAAGRRAAQRLVASWSTALLDYPTERVVRAVEEHMRRTGQPPTLAQVRASLGGAMNGIPWHELAERRRVERARLQEEFAADDVAPGWCQASLLVRGEIPWRDRQEEILSLRYRPQTREEAEAAERGAREWEAALARSEAAARAWDGVWNDFHDGLRREWREDSRAAEEARMGQVQRTGAYSRPRTAEEEALVKRVATVLRVWAHARGYGIRAIVARTGVRLGCVHGILSATREPTTVELRRIALALGTTMEEVLAADPRQLAADNLVPEGIVTGRSHGW